MDKSLKGVFIFKDLPDAVLELVASAAEERSASAGETILAHSDTPNALYVIKSGTVRVISPAGEARPITFGTGETLGDVAFAEGGTAGITAVAVERTDLLVIHAQKLAAVLAKNPEAGHQFYKAISVSLAKRLRRVAGILAFVSDREAGK